MTLYKVSGLGDAQRKVKVGKYSQKWWGSCTTGGVFVVDTGAIEGIMVVLTLVVVLKKKRQRAAERYGSGAY